MYHKPLTPGFAKPDLVLIRLVRRWAAARASAANPLPFMVELTAEMGRPPELGIAVDSLLQLVESCLERAIVAETCATPCLGPDDRAVLLPIAAAPEPGERSRLIPHGLPGAVCWAAASVRHLLGADQDAPPPVPAARRPSRLTTCPFEHRHRTDGLGAVPAPRSVFELPSALEATASLRTRSKSSDAS